MASELNLMKRMSIDEIINHALRIYGRNFLRFVLIFAITFVPAYTLLSVFAQKFLLGMQSLAAAIDGSGQADRVIAMLRSFASYGAGMLVFGVLLVLGQVTMIKTAADAINGVRSRVQDVLNLALSKFFPALITALIAVVIVLIGFLPCFVPSLILLAYLGFILQSVVLDDRNYFRAVGRSFQFVRGHFWSVFLLLFIYYVLYTMVSYAAVMGSMIGPYVEFFKELIRNGGQSDGTVLASFYGKMAKFMLPVYAFDGLLNLVLYPLLVTAFTLKYINVRNLKEGTDLSEAIRAAGTGLPNDKKL